MKRKVLGLMATAALLPAALVTGAGLVRNDEGATSDDRPDGAVEESSRVGLPEPGFAALDEAPAEPGFAALESSDVDAPAVMPDSSTVVTNAPEPTRQPAGQSKRRTRKGIPLKERALAVSAKEGTPVTLRSGDAHVAVPPQNPDARLQPSEGSSFAFTDVLPPLPKDVAASPGASLADELPFNGPDPAETAAESTLREEVEVPDSEPCAEAFVPDASPAEPELLSPAAPMVEETFTPAVAVRQSGPEPASAEHLARMAFVPAQSTATTTLALEVALLPVPAFGQAGSYLTPAAFAEEPVAGPPAPADNAQPGQVATLGDAVAYSYETNPRLLAERATLRSADYGYPAARSAYGPRVDAVGNVTFTRDNEEYIPGTYDRQQGWTDTASLILSQPILTFGRNKAAEKQALANIEYRREALRLTQDDVLISVITAYVGVLREAGAVTIARENVVLLEKELSDSRARFDVREITSADLGQVEARLSLGRTILLNAQGQLAQQQARFYQAVGMPPGELAPPEELALPTRTLPEAYSVGDAHSPLVAAARAREKVSRSVLAGARADQMPSLGFRGTADYGSVSDYNTELRATRLRGQFTLSVPIIDSGGRSAEIGRAEEANAADWRLFEAAAREARSEIAANWNRLLAARESLDHFRQAVRSSEQVYQGAQLQERAGMRTTLELLDLARDLLDVRNRYNQALADEYLARASLLAAMGQLDPQRFAPDLALYDPAVHFRRTRGQGEIPLLTGALSSLDGIVVGDLERPRPNRDPASLGGTGPFLPDQ